MSQYYLLPDAQGQAVTRTDDAGRSLVRCLDDSGAVLWLTREQAAAGVPVPPPPAGPAVSADSWRYWGNKWLYLVGTLVLFGIAVRVVVMGLGAAFAALAYWIGFTDEIGSGRLGGPAWGVGVQLVSLGLWALFVLRPFIRARECGEEGESR